MEGVVGSRLSRSSSRYGTTSGFNGPVRKWKKRWVHVPSTRLNYQNSHSHSTNGSSESSLLLCRWTPISSPSSGALLDDEPPRRKFRYTPIAVLEEQKKAEDGVLSNNSKQSISGLSNMTYEPMGCMETEH